jgi:hypothetical protein
MILMTLPSLSTIGTRRTVPAAKSLATSIRAEPDLTGLKGLRLLRSGGGEGRTENREEGRR